MDTFLTLAYSNPVITGFLFLPIILITLFLILLLIRTNKGFKVGNFLQVDSSQGLTVSDIKRYIADAVRIQAKKYQVNHDYMAGAREVVKIGVDQILTQFKLTASKVLTDKALFADLRSILESLSYKITEQIMISVESNHYASRSQTEWTDLKHNLFLRVKDGLALYISERWENESYLPIQMVFNETDKQVENMYKIYDTGMDKIKKMAIEKAEAEKEIDKQMDCLIDGCKDV
jgi:hypothetical protein